MYRTKRVGYKSLDVELEHCSAKFKDKKQRRVDHLAPKLSAGKARAGSKPAAYYHTSTSGVAARHEATVLSTRCRVSGKTSPNRALEARLLTKLFQQSPCVPRWLQSLRRRSIMAAACKQQHPQSSLISNKDCCGRHVKQYHKLGLLSATTVICAHCKAQPLALG